MKNIITKLFTQKNENYSKAIKVFLLLFFKNPLAIVYYLIINTNYSYNLEKIL